MTDEEVKEVFGRPVRGEISHYADPVPPQENPALLIEALDKVLAHPEISRVSWSQYIPYFNDGEACVFSANDACVEFVKENVQLTFEDDEDDDDGDFVDSYYLWEYERDAKTNRVIYDNKIYRYKGRDTEAIVKDLEELSDILRSGNHYVWLQETFGDPAEIFASPDGFQVSFYEHD